MNNNNININNGFFFDGLALLFIGLKLTGYITWSWVWVLSPMWVTFIVFFLFGLIKSVIDKK